MSANAGSVALAANKPLPSAYYDGLGAATRSGREKQNPVFQKLDQEISRYVNYMKSRAQDGYQKPAEESFSRPSDVLFDLWNKYQPLLPTLYYQKKVIEMGDFLVTLKEYNLADFQCFSRYLDMFGDVKVTEVTDVDVFKATYFPKGFNADNAGYTFRALMGKSICMFQVVKLGDPKLHNTETVDSCVRILNFLRLVTQVILPKDNLCWLVFNGTIHIYSVCRHLMAYGHTAKVIEYLLWASMCMETSVVLLGKKYLMWRTTLYTAICQCYYDCLAGDKAEAFARRALVKISELSKLESLSDMEPNTETETIFRHATIKMAIMVFKRAAFESRKKPKGFLRPKTRANLKDAQTLPWPRTPTEKLLVDMFEGSAAQFLCVIETLTDTNKRTLISQQPAPDSEVETLDVYAELFMAAQEIICGGGGTIINHGVATIPNRTTGLVEMLGVCPERNLMEMASAGCDGVPISAVVKLAKLAYCFEHWDVLDALVYPIQAFIKKVDDSSLKVFEKEMELLVAMQRLNSSYKRKSELESIEKEKEREKEREKQERRNQNESSENSATIRKKTVAAINVPDMTSAVHGKSKQTDNIDDLIELANVLYSFTTAPQLSVDVVDLDMIVDATLFLWSKCKAVFQKYQTGSLENWRYIQKMDQAGKWVYMLENVHVMLGWCGLSSVDPGLSAEVALRLSLALEAAAACKQSAASRTGTADSDRDDYDGSYPPSKGESRTASKQDLTPIAMGSVLDQPVKDLLITARNILELGLNNVSSARQVVALNDGKSIADTSWSKELNPELFNTETIQLYDVSIKDSFPDAPSTTKDLTASTVWNTVKDLHMELFYMYHRVCLMLLSIPPENREHSSRKTFKRSTCSKSVGGEAPLTSNINFTADYEELVSDCQKNSLVKAMLLMQKTLSIGHQQNAEQQQLALLTEAQDLITKTQAEDRRLHLENSQIEDKPVKASKVPPPPILLSRTDTTMVLKPAPFQPLSGEKVAWYRLFGRDASGSNVRVRLNDYHIMGCGDETPATSFCLFRIQNLSTHIRYVFAVSAYTADGKLIGGSIGETSKPILASHPLPVQMAWAYLAQVAYQVDQYETAKMACQILWEYFVSVIPEPPSETYVTSAQNDFKLTLYRLNKKVLDTGSPVLLRMFLTSIFIAGDIAIKEKQLYCDRLCDHGSLYNGQILRLKECQRLVVALELAGWLNEANTVLQAAIQCYGLLAPLLYWRVPSIPVIQLLERCHAVLQEIPSGLRNRRTERINDSLHHMTACMTYHLTKTLRTWGQKALASKLNDAGRKLLSMEVGVQGGELPDGMADDGNNQDDDGALMSLAALKKKNSKRQAKMNKDKDDEPAGNSQLRALEAHMLKLSKQAQGDHELSGNEDPSVLNAYIAYLPSRIAFKEVQKFKRRNRYLEFLVQVVQKAITEGFSELAIDWCEDALSWISKRNDLVLGSKAIINKQVGAIAVQGDDPKKFAAAMVEYNRQKELGSAPAAAKAPKHNTRKRNKMKLLAIPAHFTAEQRAAEEDRQIAAIERLALFVPDLFKSKIRKRRFRKICVDDMPWRAQLNIVLGLSHFGVFLNKLEMKEKLIGNKQTMAYSTAFLDPEWFTFETAGTMVVGMDGAPPRQSKTAAAADKLAATVSGQPIISPRREAKRSDGANTRASGIERAAAAATGAAPPPMFPVAPEKPDSPRTPRTPELIAVEERKGSAENNILSSQITEEALENTFNYFKKAIVLAHRGQHWTLLQNAVRTLWNCAHSALIRAFTNDATDKNGLLTNSALRNVLWFPMAIACDHWLDMMFHIKSQLEAKGMRMSDRKFSFVGDVEDDKGGASLKFEPRLDDHTVLDLQFTRCLVLRTIEMLFYERKWERLIDLALKFTSLTESRYVEQVYPLVILAQRFLADRIISAGEVVPQLHYIRAQETYGKMTAEIYSTELQLYIPSDMVNGQTRLIVHSLDYHAERDPMATSLLKDNSLAKKLVSVPLNYDESLAYYRTILEKCSYNARALRHSRRLLVLYLGGQESASLENALGSALLEHTIDFVPHTAQPQPAVPNDLRLALFASIEEVQTATLPKPQLYSVISSYEKTIEILLAHNQRSLAAQAMHELGNLQYHNSNLRAAYKWWCEAVDLILQITDAVTNWRNLFDSVEDISSQLLRKCGLWGCMLGSVITSNIAQYILTSDLSLRSTCCFLSAYFFKALFRASLPHPTADRDYASYDIGEGFEVTSLVPGIDLLSDHFRADGRSVVAALRWVTEELARGKYNLFVLPLLTLYQYFTTFVCRDLQRAVDGRILKVRVLTDLGLFAEAVITLLRLLHGDRLPHIGDSNFRQVESKMPTVQFENSKPLNDQNNLKILEMVIDKRLSTNLSSLYGPHLTCQLSIAQARLLLSLADTISVIPAYNIKNYTLGPAELMRQKTMGTMVHGGPNGPDIVKIPPLSARSSSSPEKSQSGSLNDSFKQPFSVVGSVQPSESAGVDEDGEPRRSQVTRFTDNAGIFSNVNTKAVLLDTGEKMLSALHDILTESAEQEGGVQHLKPAELEMVSQCKLLLGDLARQRHHAGMAVDAVFSAMKLLRSAEVFIDKKKSRLEQASKPQWRDISAQSSMKGGRPPRKREVKVTDEQNNQFAYQNFQSRSRLDARLWLECRFALVKNMMGKVSGMGLSKGKITKVVVEVRDCREYIEEGLYEAEVCGDSAMLAQFGMQKVLLNLMEGVNLLDTIPVLQNVLDILQGIPYKSINDLYLNSQAMILLADLHMVAHQGPEQQEQMITRPDQYLAAHRSLLSQLELLGDQMLHYHEAPDKCADILSTPVSPMKNLYLPQVSLLAEVKLRLGHVFARRAAVQSSASTDEKVFFYTNALSVLTTALHINTVSTSKHQHIESELYLALGRIQHQLYMLRKYDYHDAVTTLLRAINSTHGYDHDLGLMRQAYLEIAMIYLHSSENAHQQAPPVPINDHLSFEAVSISEREDSISVIDDSSSVASGLTVQSSSKSAIRAKRKDKQLSSSKDRAAVRKRAKDAMLSEQEKEKFAAFIAVRCAARTASAQLSLAQIVGDHATTKQALEKEDWIDVPQFMALDLVGDYVIGEQRHIYKDWVEEQMAPLVESLEARKVRTYEDVLCDAQEEAADLNWIHYLGYQNILRRMASHSSLTVLHRVDDDSEGSVDQYNQQCVRYTLYSSMFTERTASNHRFFSQHLPFYNDNCIAPKPPKHLDVATAPAGDDSQSFKPAQIRVISTDYAANSTPIIEGGVADSQTMLSSTDAPSHTAKSASGSLSNQVMDLMANMPSENEMTFQWYTPMFHSGDKASSELLLLFAVAKKDPVDKKTMKPHIGELQISRDQIIELHNGLIEMLQRAEIALVDAAGPQMVRKSTTLSGSSTASTASKGAKAKPTARAKAVSPKLKKDEAIEATLRQCMKEIYKLFGLEWPPLQSGTPVGGTADVDAAAFAQGTVSSDNKPPTPRLDQSRPDFSKEKTSLERGVTDLNGEEAKIPFEITRGSIKSLERIFNPVYGHTLSHSKLLTWLRPAVPFEREKPAV